MAGLFGYALAGAASGYGTGIVEDARQLREEALLNLKRQWDQEDRAQDHQWDIESEDRARKWDLDSEGRAHSWELESEDRKRGQDRKDRQESADAFREGMTGLDGPYIDRMAQRESGTDYGAQNPDSSAFGKYQFIDATWRDVMGDAPKTPENQEIAMRKLTDQNARTLGRAGIPVNESTLALAHQQGAGGAIRMLTDPDARAVDTVGGDAVRLNGGSSDMTNAEFAQHVMGYYGGGQPPDAKRRALLQMYQDPRLDDNGRAAVKMMLDEEIAKSTPKDPIKMAGGDSLFDPNTNSVLFTAPKLEDAGSAGKSEGDLRKEFSGLPTVMSFGVQANAMSQIMASAENPSAAGDLSLVYSYMKMLDPGSVVRESEFATAQNAAGVPEQIRNMWNRVLSGERLSHEQRKDFTSRAGKVYLGAKSQYDALAAQYRGLASQQNLKPDNIIPDFGYQGAMPEPDPVPVSTKEEYDALPSGTLYVAPNGNTMRKK